MAFLIVTLLILRMNSLIRRCHAVLADQQLLNEESNLSLDTISCRARAKFLDGDIDGNVALSLSFLQPIIFDEVWPSIRGIPELICCPLTLMVFFLGPINWYARWRLDLDSTTSSHVVSIQDSTTVTHASKHVNSQLPLQF